MISPKNQENHSYTVSYIHEFRSTSCLHANCPLNYVFIVLALVVQTKPFDASNFGDVLLHCNIRIAHEHLSQEIDTMPCVPWGAVLWQIIE